MGPGLALRAIRGWVERGVAGADKSALVMIRWRMSSALTLALIVVNVAAWGWLSFVGYNLIQGVIAQDVLGYPNVGQIAHSVVIPVLVVVVSIAPPLWSVLCQSPPKRWPLIATLALLLPYVLTLTGGM